MHRLFTLIFFVASAAVFATALPYGDNNNDIYTNDDYEDHRESVDHEDEKVIYTTPKFITESQNLMVNEAGTIKLPCIVDRLEGFVLLWKKGNDIIAVANQLIKMTNRAQLVQEENGNGNTLVISLAEEDDAGEYVCQVSAYKPTELKHSVKIRVRPEVRVIPETGIIVARTGDVVSLECEVTRGTPNPEVMWSRKERRMPSGEEAIRGNTVVFKEVTRHHSGHYVCSADNGFGDPSVANMKLDVQHAPEIEQEETFIHTGAGDNTEVICIVHSSPRAEVTWFKDGLPLVEAENVINQRGNRHTLLIPSVDETKFGRYTCKAENEFGEDEKTTEVSGRASEANIKSDPKGMEYDKFHLEWSAESRTPITHFKVQYRRSGDLDWSEVEVDAQQMEQEFFGGSHSLPGLNAATVYEARISSKNHYGYNDYGNVFKFATRGADPIQKPITGNGALSSTSFSSLLVCSMLAALIVLRQP